MKRTILALVLVGLAAGGLCMVRGNRAAAPGVEGTTAPALTAAARGPIRVVVASTGRVVSNLDVEIKAKSSGQVVKLPFDVSDQVKQGDLLVELDPQDERRRLQQAEVALAAAQAKLAQAKRNLEIAEASVQTGRQTAQASLKSAQAREADTSARAERAKKLFAQKLTSQEDYDTAHSAAVQAASDAQEAALRLKDVDIQEMQIELRRQDVKAAEAAVRSNEIDLSLQQQRVTDTVVLAPMDGVVASRSVQIGQIVSSAISNVGGGSTVMVLSDLSHLFVLASVDESDIGKVAVGQEARITADAFPGRRFHGRVVRIATRGVNTQNVVTFEVKLEVLGRDKELLKPEMTANVEIVAEEKDDALLVPAEAVTRRERGERYVDVSKDGKTEARKVEVGMSDGTNVEILGGLQEGEQVAVPRGEAQSRWRAGGDRGNRPGMGGMNPSRMLMGGSSRRGG